MMMSSHMARCVTFAVARIRVIGEILHIFHSDTESMGDRGSKKAYTGPRTGIYVPTKFGCDRSIVVGCRSRNDRQTDKQNGMTIRLTVYKRDAIFTPPDLNGYSCSWLQLQWKRERLYGLTVVGANTLPSRSVYDLAPKLRPMRSLTSCK